MKLEILITAIGEAERFIKRAKDWKRRIETDKYALISGTKEGSACKRASMDLTRALVDIRRGDEKFN